VEDPDVGEMQNSYAKFLPPLDLPAFHAPFWESIRRHAAVLQRCTDCARWRYIPIELCPSCGSAEAEWAPISGRGEIYTYTIVHRAPTAAYQLDAPYPIVHVTLDEGPRMIAGLVAVAPNDVHIGNRVRLVYDDVTPDATIFNFVPEEG
jgi:uncharacterized OB-fold protein